MLFSKVGVDLLECPSLVTELGDQHSQI